MRIMRFQTSDDLGYHIIGYGAPGLSLALHRQYYVVMYENGQFEEEVRIANGRQTR
jgi:hypothetical protein